MASERNDIKCKACGRYRHRTCPKCNTTTLSVNDLGQLTDHQTGSVHECGKASPANASALVPVHAGRVLSPDLQALVPPKSVLDSYIPRKLNGLTDIEVMSRAHASRLNVLLIGDAGVGKNHLGEALGAALQLPVIAQNMNRGTTVEDTVGQPLFENGQTVWQDGVLTHLMRHGGIFIADEVNACPPEITFALHQVTDWRRRLVLVQKGREVIEAHPDFMFIGTMNPDYRGTKPLNEAFKDRFHLVIELDYDEAIERKIIGDRTALLEFAKRLRKSYRMSEVSTPCSTRMLIDYVKNKEMFGEDIARTSLIARFAREDQKAVSEALSMHLDKKV